MKTICTYCHKQFNTPPSVNRSFCSRTCYDTHRTETGVVNVTCTICKTLFRAWGCTQRKYCSMDCRNIARGHDIRLSLEQRFWSFVDIREPDECWEWKGTRANGYGKYRWPKKMAPAHRIAYEIIKGKPDPALDICHHCDNPSCCNPNHLFAGTTSDNMLDMARKGRHGLQRHPELSSLTRANRDKRGVR